MEIQFNLVGAECGKDYSCKMYTALLDNRLLVMEKVEIRGNPMQISYYWQDSKKIHASVEDCLKERECQDGIFSG